MNEQTVLNIKEEVIKVIRQMFEEDKLKFDNFNHYAILEKIVDLMYDMPEHTTSLIQSYEKILEMIVKLEELEKAKGGE